MAKFAPETKWEDLRGQIPVRIFNAISNEGLETVGAVAAYPDKKLSYIPNFGKSSLKRLRWMIPFEPEVCPCCGAPKKDG